MIKIKKRAKPQILRDNAQQWASGYLTALQQKNPAPNHVKYRYQNSEIKDALEGEAPGKYAYCESRFKYIVFEDIEHILPKNKNARPELYVEWTNLTLSCEVYNRINKNGYYNPFDPLVDLIENKPDKHLMTLGLFIYQVFGERKGGISVAILDLDCSDLIERRKEKIENLLPLVNRWKEETNETHEKLLRSQIKKEADSDKKFPLVISSYFKLINFYN